MQVLIFKALWGMQGTVAQQLERITKAGYSGIESPLPTDDVAGFGRQVGDCGLRLVAQAFPLSVDDAKRSLDAAVQAGALFLSLHTGKDYWSFEDGCRLFERIGELEAASPILISHETHRGRLLFTPKVTAQYLRAIPSLKLTADFSHFTCVCESLLEDQADDLALAIERTVHIHARVGHQEGPQVNDFRAPEWSCHVEAFEKWWDRILDCRQKSGATFTTVVPEFGPPNYMSTLPYTGAPVADLWDMCLAMKNRLSSRWNLG